MPLFTEVLSAIDLIKNTIRVIKDSTKKKRFFVSCLFLIFFVGKQHRQKIRVLAFITISAVLFFFAHRSAEGDDDDDEDDELSVFELLLSLLLLFLLEEEREKKKLVIESSFFVELFPREKNMSQRR